MINKIFEAIYAKIFVNITLSRSNTSIYIEVCSKNKVVESAEKTFETTKVNEKMYDFINSYTQDSPYSYVSIVDNSPSQGAIGTCAPSEMKKFHDFENLKSKCSSGKWTYFTSKYDLNKLQNSYKDIGLDFIFSPYSVLSVFFKDKIESSLSMYILVEDNSLSLCVFDNSELLFAKYLDMEHSDSSSDDEDLLMDDDDDEEDDEDFELDEGEVNLDDLAPDEDMESLEDFGDIEDLDDAHDISEFHEASEIEDFEKIDEEKSLTEYDSDGFNEDYQRFSLIQSAVNTFYKDSKYESKFIESVYIADNIGVSSDLKKYLEEEMFLNVYIRQIDLGTEICELAKAELS